MATKTTTALETPLRDHLDRLAARETADVPFISLYLDRSPDANGSREHCTTFLKRTLADHRKALKGSSRRSFEQSVKRIEEYLSASVSKSANGLAVFACADGEDFFDAIQLDVPFQGNSFFADSMPHLYPLARLNDQYPRYAALLLDTNSARLFVFGLGAAEDLAEVQNPKTRRTMSGGWAQARYQRHVDNYHLHHIKEVVDVLDRVVTAERLNQIVVACDEVARPILRSHLPKHLAERVIEMMHLDVRTTPEHQVLADTLEAVRMADAREDAVQVERMLNAWRARGLAVVGPTATLEALDARQVEELLIAARPELLHTRRSSSPEDRLMLADALVLKAQQNSARIRFIEDARLLEEVGGVGAMLRFRI